MTLLGANPAPDVAGHGEMAGRSNYYVGSDPGRWRANVANYRQDEYRDVYPGIDLVYYGKQRELEHDWIVRPGADPRAITFRFEGATHTEIASNGDLVITTPGGEVRLRKPVIYQETTGGRREIAGAFALRSRGRIGFRVADYDRTRPLVIDPVLSYSTYLGGFSSEQGRDITVDSRGNAYVTGSTPADVFVTKFDPRNRILYSTYYGGTGVDTGEAVRWTLPATPT
jgi:hypothetical protein